MPLRARLPDVDHSRRCYRCMRRLVAQQAEPSEKIMPAVLSFVERGWAPARVWSLTVANQGIRVLHLIKGKPGKDVLALIKPHSGISLFPVNSQLFWIAAYLFVISYAIQGLLLSVWVDNERSLKRASRLMRWFPKPIFLVKASRHETFEVWWKGRKISEAEWVSILKRSCE